MALSPALLIPRSSGLPLSGRLLHLKADTNVTQGGATGFTATDKCCLKIADASQTGLDILASDWTVVGWIKPAATSGTQYVVYKGGKAAGTAGWCVYLDGTSLKAALSDGSTQVVATLGTAAAGSIYFFAATFDRDGNLGGYVNATACASPQSIAAINSSIDATEDFLLASDGTSYFGGDMQAIGVYNAVLSAATITAIYNAKNPLAYGDLAATTNLVSWFDLNESLIDPTHQALDSHGTNHLTFTPTALNANGTFADADGTSPPTGWTNMAWAWDTCDVQSHAMRLICNGDGDPATNFVSETSLMAAGLTVGHAYALSYTATKVSGGGLWAMCSGGGPGLGAPADYKVAHGSTTTVTDATFTASYTTTLGFGAYNNSAASWLVSNVTLKATRLYPANGFQTAIASDSVGTLHGTLTNYTTAEQVANWVAHGTGHALRGNGSNNSLACGNAGNVTGIAFSVRALATNQELFTLANSTATAVKVSGGELTFGASLTVSAITVDGEAKTAAQAGTLINDLAWHDVVLTLDSIAASNLILFTDSSAYGNVDLDDFSVSLSGAATHSYDFEDGPSTTVANGDPVLAIDSCEGGRLRFAQDNILKRPLWIASGINGKPVLRFDGVDDYLAYVGAALSGEVGTVVAFLQLSSAPNAAQTLLSQADTAGDTRFLGLYPRLNTATPNVQYSQNDAGTADTLTGDTEIAATTVYCLVWDTGGTGGIIRAFVNGVAQTLTAASGANNGDWWADLTGADVTALGALVRSAATLCGAIDLAELIVYSRVLTPGELARVLRYGTTEYGVSP